jgi:hypothetical protein
LVVREKVFDVFGCLVELDAEEPQSTVERDLLQTEKSSNLGEIQFFVSWKHGINSESTKNAIKYAQNDHKDWQLADLASALEFFVDKRDQESGEDQDLCRETAETNANVNHSYHLKL